jgi:hypothetical protein
MAPLYGRADGIAAALKSTGRIDQTLPEDIRRLMNALNAIPDQSNDFG